MSVIHKPHVPFIGSIPGGVRQGTQIVIEGHVPSWFSHQFDFNLVVGHNPTHDHVRNADIAFHFNPRFEEDAIILNDRRMGIWNAEQREYGAMPIRKGYDFEVQITVEDSYYRVSVNGQHFSNFPHRQSFRDVGLLWIDGTVDIRKVEYLQLGGGMVPASVMPGGYQPGPVFPGQMVMPAPTISAFPSAAPMFPQQAPYGGAGYPSAPSHPPGHPHHHRHGHY